MVSRVSAIPAASAMRARSHFASLLEFETDCWDVHDALSAGDADFVLLDVRGEEAFAMGHIDHAVNLPHSQINDASLASIPKEKLLVVYCAGPHCNGAYRAALKLAHLERPVKIMIGGVTGWLDEGFELVRLQQRRS